MDKQSMKVGFHLENVIEYEKKKGGCEKVRWCWKEKNILEKTFLNHNRNKNNLRIYDYDRRVRYKWQKTEISWKKKLGHGMIKKLYKGKIL